MEWRMSPLAFVVAVFSIGAACGFVLGMLAALYAG